MSSVIVQYKVHPSRVEENERLIKAVYAELHDTKPSKFRYATHKLEDGRSFVHVATVEEGGVNPLLTLPAFQEFQRGIKERCEEQPIARKGETVGSYDVGS